MRHAGHEKRRPGHRNTCPGHRFLSSGTRREAPGTWAACAGDVPGDFSNVPRGASHVPRAALPCPAWRFLRPWRGITMSRAGLGRARAGVRNARALLLLATVALPRGLVLRALRMQPLARSQSPCRAVARPLPEPLEQVQQEGHECGGRAADIRHRKSPDLFRRAPEDHRGVARLLSALGAKIHPAP
jgi:hypothetical protein